MKRQNGFTLVEVLIALALVGVLSVVAINTLRTRDMSEEYTAKRDKAAMNIEGTVHQIMFDNRQDEIISFDDSFINKVNEHLKAGTSEIGPLMRDGSAYAITAVNEGDYVANLTIDVNGDIAPNSDNQDIYHYKVTKNGNLLLTSIAPEYVAPEPEPEPTPEPDPEPVPPPKKDDDKPVVCGSGQIKIGNSCFTLPKPKPDPKPDPKPQPQPEPEPDPQPEPVPEPKPDPKPDPKPQPEPVPEPKPDPKPNPKPQPEPVPEPKPDPKPNPKPQPEPVPEPKPDPKPVTPSKGGGGADHTLTPVIENIPKDTPLKHESTMNTNITNNGVTTSKNSANGLKGGSPIEAWY